MHLKQGLANFSAKDQLVTILDFKDFTDSCHNHMLLLNSMDRHLKYMDKWIQMCIKKQKTYKTAFTEGDGQTN